MFPKRVVLDRLLSGFMSEQTGCSHLEAAGLEVCDLVLGLRVNKPAWYFVWRRLPGN
jgi:hypothetical protein